MGHLKGFPSRHEPAEPDSWAALPFTPGRQLLFRSFFKC